MFDKIARGVCDTPTLLKNKECSFDNLEKIPTSVFASFIDHTYLKPEGTSQNIKDICIQAQEHSFMSVCVQPYFISLAKSLLNESKSLVCTVVGFPLGMNSPIIKANETEKALKDGADEIDMVINIGLVKENKYDLLHEDISSVTKVTNNNYLTKVILETCLLTDVEIQKTSEICARAGAHYIKTSTGFSTGGATEHSVKLMRKTVGSDLGVKASGGVKNLVDFKNMLKSGATRIGTSNGVSIIQGQTSQGNY